ncbi:ImmA/IrrE family metallo-endopeptidase [Actinacidiphila oryziradicis]|uniref:ImmA/IrrE family metallo-endopeptidase n=2 Tax=Actinacidiphila oryziradicis TaxID=2571141 RepID=A0A4U0RHE7_9ACTN|nr:ImmA/IrrE family metallo-endopeptidase [Actinacidiphila oryziradicis]
MLVLARESRGWTQADLAAEMSKVDPDGRVSQGYVSRAEAGRLPVSGERLHLFSAALRYTPQMLSRTTDLHGVGIGLVHHRKRASLGAIALRRIHAVLALTRLQTDALTRAAGLSGENRFRLIEVTPLDTPQEAAETLREDWGVGPGPIEDLVQLIEAAGALVVVRDLATTELDAVSQWVPGGRPLFLLNSHAPPDRFRFSLAHELGHVVMHTQPGEGRRQEDEADHFAAELLMPYATIRDELKQGVDIPRLLELKARWGVSMAALIRRASSLNVITDWQYRNLMVEMSALGYRTTEPGVVPRETPQRLAQVVTRLEQQHLGQDQAAHLAGLGGEEFHEIYLCASRSAGALCSSVKP